mmetsp:Transcript_8087/g.20972  ORF Transcript_8087/g.20972 Transcript_8087/m.20972 type:complete len:270 (+) Transcript_8087:210-1019(+)
MGAPSSINQSSSSSITEAGDQTGMFAASKSAARTSKVGSASKAAAASGICGGTSAKGGPRAARKAWTSPPVGAGVGAATGRPSVARRTSGSKPPMVWTTSATGSLVGATAAACLAAWWTSQRGSRLVCWQWSWMALEPAWRPEMSWVWSVSWWKRSARSASRLRMAAFFSRRSWTSFSSSRTLRIQVETAVEVSCCVRFCISSISWFVFSQTSRATRASTPVRGCASRASVDVVADLRWIRARRDLSPRTKSSWAKQTSLLSLDEPWTL